MSRLANTIDGEGIYAVRAEQDKDGNPIRSVPSPGDNEHRGEVLTVNSSDQVVWASALPPIPADKTKDYVLTVKKNSGEIAWVEGS